MSGESYGSWDGVVGSNTQMGGQGDNDYHTATQKAVLAEDLSGIEEVVSKSGADLATLVCYTHPGLDGKQPGACPTLYYRDRWRQLQGMHLVAMRSSLY